MNHKEMSGDLELRSARNAGWGLILSIGAFSVVVNVLMLTGPIFMLQVYDRVLSSRSVETLSALVILMTFLFLLMGVMEFIRSKVASRMAARFQERMDARVFDASLRAGAGRGDAAAASESGLRDLDSVQRFMSSPVMMALFDIPWTPFFVAAMFLFHPLIGATAVAGGILLVIATILSRNLTRVKLKASSVSSSRAQRMADLYRDESEAVAALGMRGFTLARWRSYRRDAQANAVSAAETSAGFSAFSKTFRMFLQSAILAVGAWLVIRNEVSAGVMIASSIMMGRALAPIEQLVGGWPVMNAAQDGWKRLSALLGENPQEKSKTQLPRPEAKIEVEGLSASPPGSSGLTLSNVTLRVMPGEAVAVIGPSGSGKSTLARCLMNAWPARAGSVRLGGALIDQYGQEGIGKLIGYLPQRVTLFDGTIAENIARMSPSPDGEAVVKAAMAANAHDMIVGFPDGYDTLVSQTSSRLSGGQIQRIGLARAFYGDPVMLLLDEPNASLDNEGSMALNGAIGRMKASGGAVVIMAHRPSAISECEKIAVLDAGCLVAFGPRDEVLQKMVRNSVQIMRTNENGNRGVGNA